jgi:hypothetical protein
LRQVEYGERERLKSSPISSGSSGTGKSGASLCPVASSVPKAFVRMPPWSVTASNPSLARGTTPPQVETPGAVEKAAASQ